MSMDVKQAANIGRWPWYYRHCEHALAAAMSINHLSQKMQRAHAPPCRRSGAGKHIAPNQFCCVSIGDESMGRRAGSRPAKKALFSARENVVLHVHRESALASQSPWAGEPCNNQCHEPMPSVSKCCDKKTSINQLHTSENHLKIARTPLLTRRNSQHIHAPPKTEELVANSPLQQNMRREGILSSRANKLYLHFLPTSEK